MACKLELQLFHFQVMFARNTYLVISTLYTIYTFLTRQCQPHLLTGLLLTNELQDKCFLQTSLENETAVDLTCMPSIGFIYDSVYHV